jgi:hypothetical protein
MTRQQAAANARQGKIQKAQKAERLNREIMNLRSQVGVEMGRSVFGGSGIKLNLHTIQEEYVPELFTLHGRLPILERMANDPVVRGQLNVISSALISGVRWKVEGGTAEQQDLLAANLLREGDRALWCLTSWTERLYEMLGCLIHGFAMFGKRVVPVNGRQIYAEIKWLHPRSLEQGNAWVIDGSDNLIGVNRSFMDGTGRQVREFRPAGDLFIVPWDRRGPNFEGNAFIRPMYKPWKMRELAEKIDLIDLQNRGVGIPIAKLASTGGTKERDQLVSILKHLRYGSKELAFIVIGNEEEVKFLTTDGNVREAQTILDGKAADVARVGITQYLESGNTQSGSRAASSSMSTGAFIHADSIRIRLEDAINFGVGSLPGLSEELQDLNFPNIKEYARITGSRISPTEQLDNIPLIGDMVQKQVIPPNMKLANEVLKRLGYPVMNEAEWAEARKSLTPSIGGRPDGAGTDQEGRDDENSRRFGLLEEKKTPDAGNRPTRRPASWPWMKSTPGSTPSRPTTPAS